MYQLVVLLRRLHIKCWRNKVYWWVFIWYSEIVKYWTLLLLILSKYIILLWISTDIDECANGEARCASDQTCLNKPGGYTCSCPVGHMLKDRRCEDINECEFYKGQVCPVNTECMNTVGSYRCECNAGFKKIHEDDKVCVDIDECTDIQGLCAQRCINFWGAYRCACETGYQLSYNNRTCDDIDECEVHKAYNLCVGICENTPGSFRCNCPEGYRLGSDNRSCQDIDECETGNYCRGHNEICTNVRGSYRCTQIQCPNEYIRDTEKKKYTNPKKHKYSWFIKCVFSVAVNAFHCSAKRVTLLAIRNHHRTHITSWPSWPRRPCRHKVVVFSR